MNEALATKAAFAWDAVKHSASFGWRMFVAVIEHSPKIAAGSILGLGVALYFGYATLPVKSDPVIATQMTGLKAIVDDLTATVASKEDIGTLSARIGVLEHPKPQSAPPTTGSISKPSKK